MLFGGKANVLLITKLKIFLFSCRKKQKEPNLMESWDWNAETIVERLLAVRKKTGLSKTKIILGDDIVYLASLWIDREKMSSGIRPAIEQKLAGMFPENISDIVWDYKKFLTKDRKSLVQAAGIDKKMAVLLESAFLQSKISVSHVEPLSFAIAKLVSSEENPHLVVYISDVENIILFCSKGVVFHSQLTNRDDLESDLKQFTNYIKESYSDILLEKPKLFYSGSDDYDPGTALNIKEIEVVNKKLDPISGFVYQESRGRDEDILNIDLNYLERKKHSFKSRFTSLVSHFKKKDKEGNDDNGNENNKDSKRLVIMLVIMVILLLAAVILLLNKYRNVKVSEPASENAEEAATVSSDSNTPLEPEPVLEVVEEPTEETHVEEYDLKSARIEVLNGSGIAGEAGRIKGILNDAGYKNIEIGNADSNNYENMTISAKKEIPQTAFDEIKGLFPDTAITISETPLEESDPYDTIIILGK